MPIAAPTGLDLLDPSKMTAGALARQALKECGAIGVGQSPTAEDLQDAQFRLQLMLQQWERKSQLIYRLATRGITSTGALTYSIGPGGDIDTNLRWNPFTDSYDASFGPTYPVSARPAKIESSFVRQLTLGQPNQIDYPMRIIQTRNDYNRIALKQLQTFPGYLFFDPTWPLGTLFPWPVPQANIYALYVTFLEQLPPMFATSSAVVDLPFEYFAAILYNLAMRLRSKYGIATYQGDQLPQLAKDALEVLTSANLRITQLVMPNDLLTGQQYNIFSDRMY
jgi:hypothetical protein